MLSRMMPLMVFAMMLFAPLSAGAQIGTMYRGFIWGVGQDDVRAYEKAHFFEQVEDSLVFIEEVKGRRALIRYDFENDKLWRIKYEYVGLNYPTTDKVLDVVMEERANLAARFGDPVAENLVWKYSTFRNHPQLFSRAFARGHVTIQMEWQNDDTFVRLQSAKGEVDFDLFYTIENRAARSKIDSQKPFQLYQGLN